MGGEGEGGASHVWEGREGGASHVWEGRGREELVMYGRGGGGRG